MQVKKSLLIPFQTKHSNFFNDVIPIIDIILAGSHFSLFQKRDDSGYKYSSATWCKYHKFWTKGKMHRYLARSSLLQFNCVQKGGERVRLNSRGIFRDRRHI